MDDEENNQNISPFQRVLSELPDDEKIKVLELAHKHGIPDGDPVWHVVLLVRDAQNAQSWACQAAQAAGEAADRVRDELRALPDIIKTAEMESANARLDVLIKTAGAKIAEMAANAEAQIRVQADKSGRDLRIIQAEADRAIAEAQKQASVQFTGEVKKAIFEFRKKISLEVLLGALSGALLALTSLYLWKIIEGATK